MCALEIILCSFSIFLYFWHIISSSKHRMHMFRETSLFSPSSFDLFCIQIPKRTLNSKEKVHVHIQKNIHNVLKEGSSAKKENITKKYSHFHISVL